ncbi:MAG: hypothetical protein MUC44_01640 [Beijerinckiaceae bacterium]|nr:hypothetical protein [Beijerinckiaceae bacterium]
MKPKVDADVDALRDGARNLLLRCAGARPGESLLILHEDPELGYFGEGLAGAVADVAGALGLRTTLMPAPFQAEAASLDAAQAAAVAGHDHALFLARAGDQLRFRTMPPGSRPVVSYVLDRQTLASAFGRADYAAFVALKTCFDALFADAGEIRATCPLGTDIRGRAPRQAGKAGPADVSVKRFPMSVFAPLDAQGFEGQVAVARLLVGTGSRYYEPYGLPLASPLSARISGGRLLGWAGEAGEVARAEAHYAHVAGLFGIDGGVVHSWHAGIHPGCAFAGSAHEAYGRWSGSAFGNPRLLHFHTCGAYAPGEICWNVVDPTITVDGSVIFDRGRIIVDAVPGARSILDASPDVAALFAAPDPRIGLEDAP